MIVLKSADDLKKMRRAGRVVAEVHAELEERIKPGMTTGQIDEFARKYIEKKGGTATFLGYQGYPAAVCASINEVVVHGIPGKRALEEGDIIGVDIGVTLDGFVGDAARTFPVGKIDEKAKKLLEVTKASLESGIAQAVAGNHIGDIGYAVQSLVKEKGYSVVQDFVGHGVGRKLHEMPQVPNFGVKGSGVRIKNGMTLAIEPMINIGGWEVEVLDDGWTVVTKDKTLSAHFENTIAVTEKGPEILTSI